MHENENTLLAAVHGSTNKYLGYFVLIKCVQTQDVQTVFSSAEWFGIGERHGDGHLSDQGEVLGFFCE